MKLNLKGLQILFVVFVILYGFGCGRRVAKEPHNSYEKNKGVLVKTKALKKNDYAYTLNFAGIIKPFDRVDIGFKISGRINKILFDEGDDVIKGDILATLEKNDLEAIFRQATASFNKAKSSYLRSKKLLQDGTISPSEIEISEAEYKITKASMELSRMQLENATIYAPISGKLAFRNIEEKEVVLPNKAYFTIMNINDVILEIGVPQYQISKLFVGQKAIAHVESYPGERLLGEIHKVAMAVNDFNKLFKVEIKIPNSHELLRPGMIAKVEIEIENFKDIYLIPLNAILESNGHKFMYLKREGSAFKKVLENYYIHNNNIILLDLLNEGDRLITKGHQLLDDGVNVYENEIDESVPEMN